MTKIIEDSQRVLYTKSKKKYWIEMQRYKVIIQITFPIYLFIAISALFFLDNIWIALFQFSLFIFYKIVLVKKPASEIVYIKKKQKYRNYYTTVWQRV